MKFNKLCQHFICPQVHFVQKNLQTPQNLNCFQLARPNGKVVYNQF